MSDLSKLYTCPKCGKPNFTARGLRGHVCRENGRKPLTKDEVETVIAAGGQGVETIAARPARTTRELTLEALEVLPPVKRAAKGRPMPLAEIEDHIRELDAKIDDRTRGYHNEVIYDIVAKGLMLLKGRAAHQTETLTQFQKGNKKAAKNGGETVSPPSEKHLVRLGEVGEKGFLAWFEETFEGQQIRTARNYMNAARNAGLTSDHGLEDVEALRVAAALHEKKPTDLYRLADAPSKTPTDLPPAQISHVAEVQRDLFSYLDQTLQLRDDMEPEDFAATTQRLQATLEKLTGGKWAMVDATDDSAEHASMHKKNRESTRMNAKGKGKLSAAASANRAARNRAKIKAAIARVWAKKAKKGARK